MADTLVQFLQEAAQKHGPRDALLFKPGFRYRRWTYSQLWEGAGRVATLLQGRGLKKGDRAIIWGPNTPHWVLAFFGSLRAGVVLVPLDLQSAFDFAHRVAAKTRPHAAFVSRFTPETHQQMELPKIYFEDLEALAEGLHPPEENAIGPDDLAEIMFTSGTTGDPKGVMLTHRNLMADLEASNHYIPGKPSYRLLSILPLSHMFEQMACLLMALNCGANITYPTSRQASVLFRTMQERKITTMLLVPQVLDLFMKGIEREVRRQGRERQWKLLMKVAKHTPFLLRRYLFWRVHQRLGGHLDFIVTGGSALDPELGEKWALLGVKVIQGYGATEAAPVISCHMVKNPRFDSVGLPIPCTDVKIAEDGEILVRGPNITPGYWEMPEQTAAVFQDGWYKTGDLGFIDKQGFLHIKGRKKDMIALADGQKVFPEDIETILRKHPGVTDAVVVGLPKNPGVEVHAALILKESSVGAEVVSWTNSQLAEHQHIRGYTVWQEEDFPRTHTLKVKKSVVMDIIRGVTPSSPAFIVQRPSQPQQARGLRHILAEFSGLPLEQVTPEKTLGADLNLDSLKRVELLSAIEEELGVYLDEGQVGSTTTVQQLSALVEQGSKTVHTMKFPRWGMSLWCRIFRSAIQRVIIFPLGMLTYKLRVNGKENLKGLRGPVIFAANHHLHLDNGLIIKAISPNWRRRLAIAAAAELWQKPLWAIINPLVGNGFPFSKEGAVRASLDNLGRILDDGWSVLIFPEGELTIGGPLKPLKSGVGLIAVEARVPVVPLRLKINDMGKPSHFPVLRKGDVEIRFGKPMTFAPNTSYVDATQVLERVLSTL